MAITQIIGPRIKPMWADPVEWTSTRAYDADTYVTYQGDSYATRQPTPIGIQITNKDYWVKISEFNAQAVAMQNSVNNTLEANESAMQNMLTQGTQDITTIKNEAISSMNESVQHVDSVAAEFSSSINKVNAAVTLFAGATALCVGDSWAAGEGASTNCVKILCDRLGMSLINVAVPGQGFNNQNYYKQLTGWCESATQAQKESINFLLVVVSVNDSWIIQDNFQQYCNLVNEFLTYAKNNIPKAQPLFLVEPAGTNPFSYNKTAGGTHTNNLWQEEFFAFGNYGRQLAAQYYGIILPTAIVPNYRVFEYNDTFPNEFFQADSLHPTDLGHKLVADAWLSCMSGNEPTWQEINSITCPQASLNTLLHDFSNPNPWFVLFKTDGIPIATDLNMRYSINLSRNKLQGWMCIWDTNFSTDLLKHVTDVYLSTPALMFSSLNMNSSIDKAFSSNKLNPWGVIQLTFESSPATVKAASSMEELTSMPPFIHLVMSNVVPDTLTLNGKNYPCVVASFEGAM